MPVSRRTDEPALNHHAVGFAPRARADARVLVLGSLPGRRSLELHQYYGQPRNAFWRIISELTGVPAEADYETRIAGLLAQRIALWDVIASARRPGSLDASIDRSSLVVNDFAGFFAQHRRIERVCCNGGTAMALYRRLVLPTLDDEACSLPLVPLPSTSPAHAAMRYAEKRRRWLAALRGRPGAATRAARPQSA
jgi:hypoxanthine-DNA glycosylase